MYGSGNSNRDSINLVGWDGVGRWEGGTKGIDYVFLWLIHIKVLQKTTKFCKAIILKKIN